MKKLLLIITVALLFIPVIVFAADTDYEIESLELLEKSETTEILSDATTDGSNMKFDIQFLNVDDYARYKIVVKNNSNLDLKFNEKSIVLDNPYIGYDFDYENNSKVIKANKELTIYIKISYKEYVPSNLFRSNIYDGSTNLLLNLNDGFISIPNTLKNMGVLGILLSKAIVGFIIVGIVLIIKNRKASSLQVLVILLLLMLCPSIAKAAHSYDIPIDSGVKVLGTKPTICNTGGALTQGLEYRISPDSQYVYRYKQAWTGSEWKDIESDGWGVKLVNPDSTDDVTETLCSTIDDKPMVNMDYMFLNTKAKHIDLSSFVTDKVESMTAMFLNAEELEEIDFRTFNTESVKYMNIMLQNCKNLETITLRQFVTSNVLEYASMFNGDEKLEYLNLDGWDVTKAGVSGGHIGGTPALKEVSVKEWKISENFTNWISRAWSGGSSPIEKLDVTGWDLSNTTSIEGLLGDSKSLKTIVGLDTWDTSNLTNINYAFINCSALEELDLSGWDTSNITSYYSICANCTNLQKLKMDGWDVRKAGVGGGQISNTPALKEVSAKNWIIPASFANWISRSWSGGSSPIEKIDVTGWDLSNTTDINGLLGSSASLKTIVGIKDWDTSNLTNINYVFYGCSALEEIDLSGWNISNVTTFQDMFSYTTNLKKINLSNWDFAKVNNTTISLYLYYYDQNPAVEELILDGTKYYNSMNYAYSNKLNELRKISFKNADLSNVTTMEYSFYNHPKLKEILLDGIDTSNITSMRGLFSYNRVLETIDISMIDTSSCTDMVNMFYKDASLKYIDLSTLDFSSNPSVNGILNECPSLETIILDNWDLTKISNYYSIVWNVPKLKLLSLKNWVLPEDFNYYELYNGFGASPRNVVTIDVTGWDLSRTKKMYDFFSNLHGTKEIKGLNTWDTSGIENMRYLFSTDYALEKLDFSSWDLRSIVDNEYMLTYVSSLRELITPKYIPEGVTIRLPKRMVDSNGNVYTILSSTTPTKTKLVEDSNLSKFVNGKEFNKRIRKIAGINQDYNVEDSSLVSIYYKGYVSTIDQSLFTEDNKLTVSGDPLYGIYDSTKATVYIYAAAPRSEAWDFTVIFNEDCSYMFANFTSLKEISIYTPDTGKVTNMSYMFYKTGRDTTTRMSLPVFSFNTVNVTNMERMYSHTCENNTTCSIYNLKPSHWNVRNVTNMKGMFEYSAPVATDPFNGNTLVFSNATKVTDMSSMYEGALRSGSYTSFQYLGLMDTTSLKTTKNMFKNALSKVSNNYDELYLDLLDTSGITDMSGMFEGVNIGKEDTPVDLGTLNLSGTAKTDNMFKNFNNYKITLNIKNKPSSYTDMFKDAVTNGSITVNYTSKVNNIDSIIATKGSGSNVTKGQLIKDN